MSLENADDDDGRPSAANELESGCSYGPNKRQKTSPAAHGLYKQPTNQELNSLRQAESLFHSSLFRLQVEELLKEVKSKKKHQTAIAALVTSLTSFLLQLPDQDYPDASDSFWTEVESGIHFPARYSELSKRKVGGFRFESPSAVLVVGGYPLGLSTRPNVHVDLAVEMPKSWFEKSDRINHGYHQKRAFYLACLAMKLKDSELCEDLQFSYFHGDSLKPVLLMKPKGKLSKKATLVLLPHLPPESIKMQRFAPLKSNVNSSWFFQKKDESISVCDVPTPKYNASILTDLTFERNLQLLGDIVGDVDGIKEGIILLKVWLHQRQLDSGHGGFSAFILSMYAAYLLQTKKLSRLTSSYQLARNVWLHLKQSSWTTEGISLCQTSKTDKHAPSLVEFHAAYEVVFVDASGYVNLCANMSRVTFQRVRHEAELALELLDTCGTNSFDALFMTPVPFLRKFDHVICFQKLQCFKGAVNKLGLNLSLVDNNNDYTVAAISKIIELLVAGLGSRIKFADVHLKPAAKWPVSKQPPSYKQTAQLMIGFLLDPVLSTSVLDKGPAADNPEAVHFREFWGDLSELRRFHDSSICEAVVWAANNVSERRMVCQQVVRQVLQRHAGILENDFRYVGGSLESLLRPRGASKPANYGSGEEETVAILKAYEVLAKKLRTLEGLVLPISSIQGISPVFRYTEVFSQLPVGRNARLTEKNKTQLLDEENLSILPSLLKPLTVILRLEGSSKWPKDVAAIRSLKAAFHITLAELLSGTAGLPSVAQPAHADVFLDGFLFRLVVFSPHELTALREVRTETGLIVVRDTDESTDLEAVSVTMPKITTALHGLQLNHASYGATCRLAKRWLGSQLLSDHVPDICIDLVVAQLFLSPYPYTVSVCPQVGFLRFLQFLVSHDWHGIPLIVNLNNKLTNEQVIDIQNKFTERRPSLPAMFIVTPFDTLDSHWTRRDPTLQILHRMTVLALESIKTIEAALVTHSLKSQYKVAFRPPLEPYDVVINLDVKLVPTHYMAVDSCSTKRLKQKPFSVSTDKDVLPVVDFNPALIYLKNLREAFDHLALFFYDPYGGSCIAVLWKPSTFVPQPFKIAGIDASMLSVGSSGGPKVAPNVLAIVEDFKLMGQGLVLSVESRSEKWSFA